MKQPYVKLLGKMKGFEIWSINGEHVREKTDSSFVLAGHHWAFDYIPENEIWIEDIVKPEEVMFLVLHELCENKLMTEGLSYEDGHDCATICENAARKHPQKVKEILSLL